MSRLQEHAPVVDVCAAVYAAAAVDYLVAELLDLSGNVQRELRPCWDNISEIDVDPLRRNRARRILPRHIHAAMNYDIEGTTLEDRWIELDEADKSEAAGSYADRRLTMLQRLESDRSNASEVRKEKALELAELLLAAASSAMLAHPVALDVDEEDGDEDGDEVITWPVQVAGAHIISLIVVRAPSVCWPTAAESLMAVLSPVVSTELLLDSRCCGLPLDAVRYAVRAMTTLVQRACCAADSLWMVGLACKSVVGAPLPQQVLHAIALEVLEPQLTLVELKALDAMLHAMPLIMATLSERDDRELLTSAANLANEVLGFIAGFPAGCWASSEFGLHAVCSLGEAAPRITRVISCMINIVEGAAGDAERRRTGKRGTFPREM
eukprot:6849198-Prymnesium_polylepis.1